MGLYGKWTIKKARAQATSRRGRACAQEFAITALFVPAGLSGRTRPIRSKIGRVVPIEQVLPDEAARVNISGWRNSASILGGCDDSAALHDASGRIASGLAINRGTRAFSISGNERNY